MVAIRLSNKTIGQKEGCRIFFIQFGNNDIEDTTMLSVTETALEHLHSSLAAFSADEMDDKCFRITPKSEESLGLSFTEPAAGDTKYTFNDRVVLALPKDLERVCSDKTLDVNEYGGLELS